MLSYTLLGRYDTFDHWSRHSDDNRASIQEGPESTPVPIDRNLTGDEAFQRRLAMSARPRSPPKTAVPASQVMEEDLLARDHQLPAEPHEEVNLYQSEMTIMHPPAPFHEPPRPISPPTLAYNPFAPPSVPPPPPGPHGTSLPSEFEAKAKAAAAIAAKLSALAAVAATSEPQVSAPPIEESKYVS